MPALNDRQRIELALPCVFWHALVCGNCFGPDPGADPAEAEAEIARKVPRLRELLGRASNDPLADLPPKKRRQMERRIDRESVAACKSFDDQPSVKVAMLLYHFTKELLDAGILELWEGSAMGEAMDMLFPMFEHGFERERMDASAQKQARRLLESLQRAGFYRGAAQAEAA